MRKLACLLMVACLLPISVQAASTTKPLGKTITVIQSVTGITALATDFKASVGNVDFSQATGLRSQVLGADVPNPGGIVSMPALLYGDGTRTPGEIKALAKGDMNPRANAIAASLKSWMNANGVSSGSFVFEQEVKPRNVSRNMKVVWQVLVTDSGRPLFGDPRVVDGDPTIVYLMYVPKAVDSGLPSSWSYPDAGQLKWQLRRKDGTPVTSWTTVDTAGAFDEPSGTNVDPDKGMRCIVNKASDPSCPTGYVDAKGLVADYGSLGAIIDYVRKVQPVYDEVNDPDRAGEKMYQPRMSLSYDTRSLDSTGCSNNTYRNVGRYGFTLSTVVDRYFYDESIGVPYQVNRFTGTSISPTQNFDITQATTYRSSQLQGMAFNPVDSGNPLVAASTLPGVIYLAPITVNSTPANVSVVGANVPYSITQSGSIVTINADQPNFQNWGVFDFYVDVNVPRANIEWAQVTRNQADDGNLIFVNGTAVSATSFPTASSFTLGSRPLSDAIPWIASTVNSDWQWSSETYEPYYWLSTNQQYQQFTCLEADYEGTCTRTGYVTATDRFTLSGVENQRTSSDPYLPRRFEGLLNNGVTRLLIQHFHGDRGFSSASFDFKVCDY